LNKILLVDDKKDVRDFIGRFFGERNFQVLSAANAIDALLSIKRNRPDIVLLDMELKDMDSLEVLRRVKKMRRPVKVIAVSGAGDMDIMDKARQLGVVSCLAKPLLLNELVDTVLRNIGRRRRFFELKRTFG